MEYKYKIEKLIGTCRPDSQAAAADFVTKAMDCHKSMVALLKQCPEPLTEDEAYDLACNYGETIIETLEYCMEPKIPEERMRELLEDLLASLVQN